MPCLSEKIVIIMRQEVFDRERNSGKIGKQRPHYVVPLGELFYEMASQRTKRQVVAVSNKR